MRQKKIQGFLILGAALFSLYFGTLLIREIFHYFSSQKGGKARIAQWEIIPVKDRFALKASYAFQVQEKNCQGVCTLLPPYYLNEGAALAALQEKAKQEWQVWYHGDYSALERKFPFNLMVRSVICCVVLIYFFTLNKKFSLV